MARNHLVSAALAAAFALTACGGGSSGQGVVPQGGGVEQPSTLALQPSLGLGPANGYYPLTTPDAARPLCPATADTHRWRCFAWIRTDLHPNLSQVAAGTKGIPTGVGFTPADIQSAYHLNPSLGGGQTVYIIDAFGYKRASKDLAVYRAAAGLPKCAGSCFKILNQEGKSKPLPPPSSTSWEAEQSLDFDAVSAACPKCNIVLIETNDDYDNNLEAGIAEALTLGAKIVSMSFGGPEFGSAVSGLPTSGGAFVASAGDSGGGLKVQQGGGHGGPQMPCTYAEVVCVGGTALTQTGNGWSEVAWNDETTDGCGGPCGATGSACSTIVPKPSWQSAALCKKRAAADVSAVASPLTPFAIYDTPYCKGWCGFGGTSLAAPLIAGTFGLAGNATSRHAAMELWSSHAKLNDVTSGTNVYKPITGKCASKVKQVCIAGPGYDGPTGWGTPNTSTDF